jgi:serine protease
MFFSPKMTKFRALLLLSAVAQLKQASAVKGRSTRTLENHTAENNENEDMVDTIAFGMLEYLEASKNLPKRFFIKTKGGKKDKILKDAKSKGGKVHHTFDDLELIVVSFNSTTALSDFHAIGYGDVMEEDKPRFIAGLRGSSSEKLHRRQLQQTMPAGLSMIFGNKFPSSYPTSVYKQVCIIDSGFDSSHPDLSSIAVTSADGGSTDYDGCSHGTHVGGTIVAENNGYGSLGIYPGAPVTIAKVFGGSSCSYTYASSMLAAANACYNKGARIINISAGGTGYSYSEDSGYSQLSTLGVLIFAAAGNNNDNVPFYPAAYASVVSVAATDLSYNKASFSNYNSMVDVAAPGVGIYSTIHNGYASWAGTSMATPHATGMAYRLWNEFPRCSKDQIQNAIINTAKDLGSSGKDSYFGNGFIQYWPARSYLTNTCP